MMPHEYIAQVADKSQFLFDRAAEMMAGRTIPHSSDGSSNWIPSRYELISQQSDSRSDPDVTVIIPTFNRPDLLVTAVDSVCCNADVNFEVVIVNDAGTNLPAATVERLCAPRRSITVAQHHCNLGLAAARNTGAWLARGKWLMMLDDDDALLDGSMRDLMSIARDDQDALFIFGDHLRQWYAEHTPTHREYRQIGREALAELCTENLIVCGSFMITRQTFTAHRGYREDLPVHEDYNLHLRVLSSTRSAYLAKPICTYHCRPALPRLNHRRLYWFATSAFNHTVFRSLFHRTGDRATKVVQRRNQYEHLARSLREGCPLDVARSVVNQWWQTLRSHGLSDDVDLDEEVISNVCPSIRQ